MVRRLLRSALVAVALLVASAPAALAADRNVDLPTLIVEAPPELAGLAERLRAYDRRRLAPAMTLTGLTAPGPPIRVVLAPEGSPNARGLPPWVAGYADGNAGVVVIIPARVPSYPDRSLEVVVQHEVAHVLVARAAGGRRVPRWFNEGLATTAGRAWNLEDRSRLIFEVMAGGATPLARLDDDFGGGRGQVRGAYALSHAFVRQLIRDHGEQTPGRLLARVARGEPFSEAFLAVTGENLVAFESRYWRHQTLWNRWVPLFTSSAVLWLGVTALALVAFYRRRRRDAELYRRWEEDEAWREAADGRVDEPVN